MCDICIPYTVVTAPTYIFHELAYGFPLFMTLTFYLCKKCFYALSCLLLLEERPSDLHSHVI